MSTDRNAGGLGAEPAGGTSAEPIDDGARTRRVLALSAAGGVANAVWLAIAVRHDDPLASLLSGIGLLCCAVPTVLCTRRLARGRFGGAP